MGIQSLNELFNNNTTLLLIQIAIFALPPFYFATLRRPLRTAAFYIYLGIVLFLGGFLGAVYSLPLNETINISGGNLTYGALMYTAILLVIIEKDLLAFRHVIRLVITVNLLKYILFSLYGWFLAQPDVLNPFSTAPDLFAISARFMIIGGVLIILELLILLFLFERIKQYVGNIYGQFALFGVSFTAVLLLDGVLFPLLAIGINQTLVDIVVGGFVGKLAMALAYTLPFFLFLLLFKTQLSTYFESNINLRELLTLSREELIETIDTQQHALTQQKKSLQTSEERLRLALIAADQGIFDIDLAKNAITLNDSGARLLGYDTNEFNAPLSDWYSLIHPHDQVRVMTHYQSCASGEIPELHIDYRYKTKSGHYIWIAASGNIVQRDANGNAVRLLGVMTNITARKQSEEALRIYQEHLKLVLEAAEMTPWEIPFEPDEAVTDSMVMTLANRLQAIDEEPQARIHPDDKPQLLAALKDALAGQSPLQAEYRVQGPEERIYWREARGQRMGNGADQLFYMPGVISNITSRKRAEEILAERELKYRNLVETSFDLIWAIDAEGRITFMNQASHRIYGRSPEEMIGQLYTDFVPPEQAAQNAASWAVALGNDDRITNYENWVLHKDGTPVCLNANAILLRNEQGEVVGSMGASQDITERIKREEQLAYQAFLLDNVSDAIISTDLDNFTIKTWNKAAESLYGWSADEAIGKSTYDLLSTTYPDSDLKTINESFLQEGKWQGEAIQKDRQGNDIDIQSSVTLLHDQEGRAIGTVAVNRDIREQKRAEAKLLERNQFIETILDNLPVGLAVNQLDTGIKTYMNEAFQEIYGWPESDLATVDQFFENVYPDPDYREKIRAQILGDIESGDLQKMTWDGIEIMTQTGAEKIVSAKNIPIFEQNFMISMVQDITTRSRMAVALRESNEQLRAIINGSPIAIIVLGLDCIVKIWSPAAERIFGWTAQEVVGRPYPIAQSPELNAEFKDNLVQLSQGKVITGLETKRYKKEGTLIDVSINTAPIYNESGEIILALAIISDISDRVSAQRELQLSEEKFRNLFYLLPAGIFTKDVYGRYTSTNDSRKIYTQRSPIGKTDAELQPADIAAELRANDLLVMKEKKTLIFEERFVTPDGMRWMLAHKTPLWDDKGNLAGVLGATHDITARRKAEQQQLEYARRLETVRTIERAILSQASPQEIATAAIQQLTNSILCQQIVIAWLEPNITDEYASGYYLDQQVVAAESPNPIAFSIPTAALSQFKSGISLLLRRSELDRILKANQIDISDTIVSLLLLPLKADQKINGFMILGSTSEEFFTYNHRVFVTDVGDSLAIALHQSNLREMEREQRLLAETLRQTAVTLVGTVTLQETLDTILDQLALVVKHDLAQILLIEQEQIETVAIHGELGRLEEQGEKRPYDQMPLLKNALQLGQPIILDAAKIKENRSPLPGILPEMVSWVGIPLIARDVAIGFLTAGNIHIPYTQNDIATLTAFGDQAALAIEKATILSKLEESLATLRQTQAHLLRAARLTAVGETAAGVAHQINNPLTTIVLDSLLLMKQLPPEHPSHRSAKAIHESAFRAADIVERLLDFSLTKPTEMEPIDLGESIQEAINVIKPQLNKSITLSLNIDPTLPLIPGSPKHLNDVWLNLLLNARDALADQEGASIIIEATHHPETETVQIAFKDNGAGIPYHVQKMIFEPFFTTKTRGTGLGLAVCQDIILHHNGQIRIESTEGEGSMFMITLPVHSAPSVNQKAI